MSRNRREVKARLDIGFLNETNFLTLGAIVQKLRKGEKYTHIDENRDTEEQCMGTHEYVSCKFKNIKGKTQSKL